MASASDRVVFVGTAEGLYRAEPGGDRYEASVAGLQGKGTVRAPLVVDRDDPRRLYAGTNRGGMFRSEDGGGTWREINDGIVYKEIWSVDQHPRTGELIVGTGPAAIFKSVDRGDTWTECEQLRTLPTTKEWTFPNPPHVAHVKGLGLYAEDPSLIFGSVEEGWAIRTRDGGTTWQNLKDGVEFDLHYINIMPDDPATIVATSGNGFYRSQDGGDSWSECSQGLSCRYLAPMVVHPARPCVFFTAAAAVPPPGWRRPEGADASFFRTENRADSWQKLTGGLPEHFTAAPRATAGDPEDPDAFFVGMTDGSVWMSEDGGESFRQILGGLPPITSLRVARR